MTEPEFAHSEAMSALLNLRKVWAASGVPWADFDSVLASHRTTLGRIGEETSGETPAGKPSDAARACMEKLRGLGL